MADPQEKAKMPLNSNENTPASSDNGRQSTDVEKQTRWESDSEGQAADKNGPPKSLPMDPTAFPDGGRHAWLCVLGSFCCLFVSFGWINCIGVFQDYYQTHQLKHDPPSTVAWIPSLEVSIMFLGGPWIGRLYDKYGPRYILLFGSFLHVFGLMMASISSEYYQFLLSQAVCSPIGASMIFYPSLSSVMTWFMKRRALAVGIVSSGSGLGGVIFPIIVERLVGKVGFAWTMRICAFIILAFLVVANIFTKSRIPPQDKPIHIMDFIRPLKEVPFLLFSIGMLLYFFGQFIPFTFIVLEATERGISQYLASYLVSIINSTSIFGRIVPAYFADRYGRFNVMTIMGVVTCILVLALWIPATGNAGIIVFAALFGFSSGVIVGMSPVLVAQISKISEIGVRTGTMFTFVAVAILASNPIGGALVQADGGGYVKTQIFAGCMMAGGSFFYMLTRMKLGGFKLMVKV